MIEKTIEGIRSSDQAEIAKTMSESEVYLYTGITGDFNPVPINQVYAEKNFFQVPDRSAGYPHGFSDGLFAV